MQAVVFLLDNRSAQLPKVRNWKVTTFTSKRQSQKSFQNFVIFDKLLQLLNFVKVLAYFLGVQCFETIQKFKEVLERNAFFDQVKIFRRRHFISFENVKIPKIFRVFVDFAQFYYLNQLQLAQYQIQSTQEDVHFTLVQTSMF